MVVLDKFCSQGCLYISYIQNGCKEPSKSKNFDSKVISPRKSPMRISQSSNIPLRNETPIELGKLEKLECPFKVEQF